MSVRLRVGIDLASLYAHGSGIPVFTRQVLEGIAACRPDWPISGFSSAGWSDVRDAIISRMSSPADRRPLGHERFRACVSSMALGFPLVAEARRAARCLLFSTYSQPNLDLFHAINFLPPGPVDCPIVPVVHDLFHLIEPAMVHPARRRTLARLPEVARSAPRVQCVSRHTADDVNRLFRVPADRLDIVYPAVRAAFLAAPELCLLEPLGFRPRGYWLAVGMVESRKNLRLLLNLADHFPDLFSPEHPLVVTGAPPWQKGEDWRRMQKLRAERRLCHLGFVPVSVLAALYAYSTALLMPSLYEGFGLPLMEALAAGARVIAADNSSLREVSGGHAVHLDAADIDAWSVVMNNHLTTSPHPAAVAAGKMHARRFDCESTTRAALASLEAA